MLPNRNLCTDKQKCGFVAVVGEPNSGKSTLVNAIVGEKISITSKKAQTTRLSTLGISIYKNSQIILLDTPGIFSAKKQIDKAIVKSAWQSVKNADLIIFLIDPKTKDINRSLSILKQIPEHKKIICAINKIDINPPEIIFDIQKEINKHTNLQNPQFFQISGLKKQGLEKLLTFIDNNLSQGPFLYPEDTLTNQPEQVWLSEFTREQIYRQLHEEILYEVYIEHESFENFEDGSIKISQAIVVARESQKKIIIGHKGSRIKNIGINARKSIEKTFRKKVHLKLFVKLNENWMEKSSIRREIGFN